MLLVECPAATIVFFIDTNAGTGVQIGEEDCKVIGAYGTDTRVSDSNGTSLLRFAGDNKLALVNTLFSVFKGCTSRTFNGIRPADRKRIDYIITRQPHQKLVRNVTVHLQPCTDSDHNIVCPTVRLRDRLARNRKQPTPTGCKSMDRRAITSDTNWREGLIQRIASQLTHRTRGHSRQKSSHFYRPTLTVRRGDDTKPIRQGRVPGSVDYKVMDSKFEQAWTKR